MHKHQLVGLCQKQLEFVLVHSHHNRQCLRKLDPGPKFDECRPCIRVYIWVRCLHSSRQAWQFVVAWAHPCSGSAHMILCGTVRCGCCMSRQLLHCTAYAVQLAEQDIPWAGDLGAAPPVPTQGCWQRASAKCTTEWTMQRLKLTARLSEAIHTHARAPVSKVTILGALLSVTHFC